MCYVDEVPVAVKNTLTAPKSKPGGQKRSNPRSVTSSVEQDGYTFEGNIDFHGYHSLAKGWFVGGWIAYPWPPGQHPEHAAAVLADNSIINCTLSTFYDREDLSGRGVGFIFFFPVEVTQAEEFLCTVIMLAGAPPVRWTAGFHWCNRFPHFGHLFMLHLKRVDINWQVEWYSKISGSLDDENLGEYYRPDRQKIIDYHDGLSNRPIFVGMENWYRIEHTDKYVNSISYRPKEDMYVGSYGHESVLCEIPVLWKDLF